MSGPDATSLRRDLARFADEVVPTLPLPARGATPARLAALADVARRDLAVARLAEAHADAVAILADAGRRAPRGARYGVWAARGRDEVVSATAVEGGWRLAGRKPWCTGVGIVTHGLLTAESHEGTLLVQIAPEDHGVGVAATPWSATAFAATGTVTLEVDLVVSRDEVVGAPGSYLDRPGFWHGATGVAACWVGGLVGLAERAGPWWRRDAHATVHRAAVDAQVWAVTELLAAAGRDADAHPDDGARAQRMALRARHLVDAAVGEVITRVRRGCGPAPFAFDAGIDRRVGELELYVRQCHAERDLEALGHLLDEGPPAGTT